MGYTRYDWETGDLISAARLNNIEEGISQAISQETIFSQIGDARVIFEDCNKVIESNNVGYPAAQGMCAIDDTHIAIAYIGYTNAGGSTEEMDNGKIKVINLDDGTYREGIVTIGHANSLTYNPDDNVIYCVPFEFYAEGVSARVVLVIDYDTLTLTETIPMTLPTVNAAPTAIAYDRENQKIYMRNSIYIFEYDKNFNYKRMITLQNSVGVGQGMEYYNGFIIQTKNFGGDPNDPTTQIKGTIGSLIQIHSLEDGSLFRTINIPTIIDDVRVYEPEEPCVFPNGSAAIDFITRADAGMRIASVFGMGFAIGDMTKIDETVMRRRYFVDSTATGLGIGTEPHPFKSIHQLGIRLLSNKHVTVKKIDDTAEFEYYNAKGLTISFASGSIVNAPDLRFKGCDVALAAQAGFSSYPADIYIHGQSNAAVGFAVNGDVYCYMSYVRVDENISGLLYVSEGAVVRTNKSNINIGKLWLANSGVMFLGKASYNTLKIEGNGTLINPSADT